MARLLNVLLSVCSCATDLNIVSDLRLVHRFPQISATIELISM